MTAASGFTRFAKNFIPLPGFQVPTVGQMAPDFTLHQIGKGPVKLSDYRGKQPVVLAFTRILTEKIFCPFCYPHIQDLKQRYSEFERIGVEFLMVASTDVQQSGLIVADLDLPYPFLSDPECTTFRAYGAGQALGVPLPAQYIVDREGVIQFRHLFSFSDTNASPDVLLAAIDRLET